MKKMFFLVCVLTAIVHISHAQAVQRKLNTAPAPNSTIKKVAPAPAQNPPPAPPTQSARKMVVAAPVANRVSIVPLNSKSGTYRNYIGKVNTNMPPGLIRKLTTYAKTYTYADGTKTHVSLINSAVNSAAKQPNGVVVHTRGQTTSGDDANDCTTTNISLTASSDDFMNNNYSSQASFIYPGAIYTYDNLFNGNFREESTGRNPVIITTNNTNISGNSYEVIAQPNQVNIQNAITKLFQRFSSINAANESTAMRIFEADNSADLNMKLGVDASGYGVSFDGYLGQTKNTRTEYLTVDCIKTLFSISVAIPDSGYYKKDPGPDSHLTVIGTVNYGVRVLANVKVTFQSEQDEAGFNAGYSGWGVQTNVDFNFLSSNSSTQSTINAYYVGGPSSYTTTSFDKSQLQNQVTQYLQNANYQNAVPISYELYDLTNNMLSTHTATDQFPVPLCIPKALDNATIDCSGNSADPNATHAVIQTGNNSGDNKDADTHYSFGIFDNNDRPIASFHDDSNNDPYHEGNTTPSLYVKSQNAAAFKDFVNGGRIHLNIAPNGHDTWNMQSFSLFLGFNNPASVQKLTWSNIGVSESNRDVDLSFKYDKNTNTLQAQAY